jgi:hypothetical protein
MAFIKFTSKSCDENDVLPELPTNLGGKVLPGLFTKSRMILFDETSDELLESSFSLYSRVK